MRRPPACRDLRSIDFLSACCIRSFPASRRLNFTIVQRRTSTVKPEESWHFRNTQASAGRMHPFYRWGKETCISWTYTPHTSWGCLVKCCWCFHGGNFIPFLSCTKWPQGNMAFLSWEGWNLIHLHLSSSFLSALQPLTPSPWEHLLNRRVERKQMAYRKRR